MKRFSLIKQEMNKFFTSCPVALPSPLCLCFPTISLTVQCLHMNSITSMQGDVSFIPAVPCASSSGSTDLPLPAYLASTLYQHCLKKPLAANRAKIGPKNQQHNWSRLGQPSSTAWGGRTALSQGFWAQ